MLKKLAVLLVLLGVAFALMMLTTRHTSFAVVDSLAVARPPEVVWAVLTEIEQWPQWWPGVQEARIAPAWQAGATMEILLKGNPDRSPATLETVAPGRQLAWRRPGVLGSIVRTTLGLEPQAEGTRVVLESAIVGPQAFLARFTGEEEFSRYHRQVLLSLQQQSAGRP